MRKKILLIDDDADILEILSVFLEDPNFEIITQRSLIPLSLIQEISPDVIVLDYNLGDKLGSELCLELKADPVLRAIPVIFLSAHQHIAKITKDTCADAYLEKPFNGDKIKEMVIKWVH